MCLCGFLGYSASFVGKLEKDFYDFPSWENEAGKQGSVMFLKQLSVIHETEKFECKL
jgi:hypothetical protein